jgi:hypothetical protein
MSDTNAAPGAAHRPGSDTAEHVDALPDDLNAVDTVRPYDFPDNSRRRIPAVLYLTMAVALVVLVAARGTDAVLVNGGFLLAAAILGCTAVISFTSGWRMHVDERQALVAAQGAVGFAVGHASAQQVWRGVRSRPTWRVLVYSTESPPRQRALVLVDAVDGTVVEHLTQDNPVEDWSELDGPAAPVEG